MAFPLLFMLVLAAGFFLGVILVLILNDLSRGQTQYPPVSGPGTSLPTVPAIHPTSQAPGTGADGWASVDRLIDSLGSIEKDL